MSPNNDRASRHGLRSLLVGTLLSLPLVASAQTADPAAPFLGTWSGVFTTQDHEYWGAEDLACFVGCPLSLYKGLAELFADPANDERSYFELNGQASAIDLQQFDAMLTPLGRQIQAANTSETDPKLYCQPYGYVREVTNPLPMLIQRDGEHLLIRYEEWSELRPIYMDGRAHPEHHTPTLLGHAVGRIENGVLIVETAGVTPDWYSDYTHAGHSGELTC